MDKVESISVYPAAPPKTSKIIYYTRMALFGLTSVTVMLAVCMLMLPTLLVYSMRHPLLLVSHKTNHKRIESAFYTFYRHIVRFIEGIWGSFVIVLCFLLTPGKIIITGDSSGMGETLRCVVMANHQIYPDCTLD